MNAPNGNATYCNMNYLERGGNAATDENNSGIGTFSWTSNATCTPLGLEEISLESIAMYPNPATNQLVVNGLSLNEKISIYDLTGKLLLQKTTYNATETIDTSHLKSGLYFISLENGMVIRKGKFIKQ
ncbi:T9SS type A sorting domain-containing protein [Flavobacterium sp.]|uniref:T9SS type A sorting domain-containing protein n=1 Tax=Flavobacterium sp. TaxID=239 RepID=UPI00286C4640|nr:T9SS type A sorting domain-containing protein [Flavobacterium sp.]